MKLTKKLQAEILKIYHAYWDAYLAGDIKTFASMLDDNIKVFGTADSEVFNNKAEAVRFYKATADQITGKAQFRNRKIKMHSVDKTVLIHEQGDLFVLIENEWIFYSPVRVSAIFVNTPKGWKLTHQHGSFPDSRAEAGEQIAPEKIRKENLELREAIKRRTVELENKNRELEIEASLEKVRTIAMGMRKPDDMLDVCKTISLQLQSLGVKEIRNVQTAIFYEQRGTYMNYEYYSMHDKTIITETVFTNNKIHNDFATKMMRGKGETFITHIKGSKVKDWIAYQKTTNVFIDKYLETASSLNYYWFSLGPVALGISTYIPLTEDEINLFKRFLKVFELAYQRYLDIEKAEAQAREAQIEASLERVRAVAMSMNKPDDLLNICEVSFNEFKKLGFDNLRNSLIHILDDEKEFFLDYDFSDSTGGKITNIFYKSHPIVENYLAQIRGAEDAFAEIVINGSQLNDWKDFRLKTGQQDDPRLNNIQALYYYGYSIGVGDITISTFKPIDESRIQILKRFRNVFDLAYRRYRDIALAEAQAKEAKIEAALEKVRAVALSLKKSDEMLDIAEVLYEQLLDLGFTNIRNAIIDIHNESDETFWDYDYSHDMGKTVTLMSYHDDPIIEKQVRQIESSSDAFFELILEGQDLHDLIDMRLRNGENEDPRLRQIEQLTYNLYSFGNGAIGISNFGLLSDEQKIVLKRFRNVFAFAYKRYNDLVLAETQAREAQIETALERVRSRTMGMQKSEELKEVIRVVYEQFVHLKIKVDHAGFVVDYTPKGDWHFWIADEQDIPSKITHPYFESVWANQFNEAKEKGADFFTTNLNFEEKNKFYNELLLYVPGLPEASKHFYLSCPGLAATTVLFDNVSLYIENFSGIPYTDEENNMLMRFGKVFQQTYTRFLDLQRAEAQNKIIQAENDRKTKELEEARQLQLSMLPKKLPQLPNLDIAVYMKTATEVGGDYYDFNVDGNGILTFVVGDATGHGMMSGMMVSIMKSFFISSKANIELKQFFENSNNSIKDMQLGRLMMGLIGIQITTEKIIATNAGMPSLIYFRNKSQKAGEFVSNNLPLGGMKGTQYSLKEINYERGDTLLLMSDGFAELKNPQSEQYGYTRAKEQFRSISHKSANEIIEELKNTALQWLNGAEPDDDVTFVVIKVK